MADGTPKDGEIGGQDKLLSEDDASQSVQTGDDMNQVGDAKIQFGLACEGGKLHAE